MTIYDAETFEEIALPATAALQAELTARGSAWALVVPDDQDPDNEGMDVLDLAPSRMRRADLALRVVVSPRATRVVRS